MAGAGQWTLWQPVAPAILVLASGVLVEDYPPNLGMVTGLSALSCLPGLIAAVTDTVLKVRAFKRGQWRPERRTDSSGRQVKDPGWFDLSARILGWGMVAAVVNLPLMALLTLAGRVEWSRALMPVAVVGLGAAVVVLMGWLVWILFIIVRAAVGLAASAIGPRSGKNSSGSRWLDGGAALYLGGVIAVIIGSLGHSAVLEGSSGGSRTRGGLALVKIVVWAFTGGGPAGPLWVARAGLAAIIVGVVMSIRRVPRGRTRAQLAGKHLDSPVS